MNPSFLTGFTHEFAEVFIESRSGFFMPFGVSFFIIVSELDKYIVTRTDFLHYSIPTSLIDKAFRTSAIYCMVLYTYIFCKKASQYMPPTSLQIAGIKGFVPHG